MSLAEPHAAGGARGVTLLELLLVLLLIGVLANAARVSVGRRDDGAQAAAGQLLALAGLAAEEAVLRNRDMGLQIHRSNTFPPRYGYAWSARSGEEWSILAEPPFEPRWLSESLVAEIELEGRRLRLPEQASGSTMAAPQLHFSGSGEWERFRIEIRGESGRISIEGDQQLGLRLVEGGGAR